MGEYKIEIVAVGGHGCDRKAKQGEALASPPAGCSCPDCKAEAFVSDLRRSGGLQSATLTHWPDTPEEVVDDLAERVRVKGSFSR